MVTKNNPTKLNQLTYPLELAILSHSLMNGKIWIMFYLKRVKGKEVGTREWVKPKKMYLPKGLWPSDGDICEIGGARPFEPY